MPRKRTVDYAEFLRLWRIAKPHMTMKEFARSLGKTPKSVDNILSRARKEEGLGSVFDVVDLGMPLRLSGNFMIIGDIQIPTTDIDFAMLVPEVAKKHLGAKPRLLLAGDIMNLDCFSFYDNIVNMPTWTQERDAFVRLIEEYYKTFDEIYMIMGNHERRFQRFFGGVFGVDEFTRLLGDKDIKASNFGYCVVETEQGDWRVTHAKNYSVLQLNVADNLAQKHQQHIINHHEHHLAKGWDRYKRHIVINNGGAFDVDKMAYVALDDSKSPNMAKGFTMLRDGYAHVFGEAPFTNWNNWL